MTRFPNFIIIGAGKCGTTSIYSYLKQHPEIYLCSKKETFFFINSIAREKHRKWGSVTTQEEYLALFTDAPDKCTVGEISTNYYAYPESAELIHNAIPNVKIIAILRDPAKRAFSAYQMFVRNGHEKRSFSEVIAAQNQHITRGFYYQELLPFYKAFREENIKILLFDDLVKDSKSFLKDLFEFIGVNPEFSPDTSKRGREGGLPQNPLFHKLLTKHNPVRAMAASVLKTVLPLEARQKLRTNLVNNNISKVTLDKKERNQLIEI